MNIQAISIKRLSYQKKIRFLPFILIVFLFIIFNTTIKDTLQLILTCNKLEAEIRTANNAPYEIEHLSEKLRSINLITGEKTQKSELDPFLEFCSNYDNTEDINLIDYKPLHNFHKNNFQIDTRIATFEGNFKNLLKFLFNLEKKFKSGITVSVKFYSEVNYKANKKDLYLTIYIQTIKNYDGTKTK